MTRRAWRVRVAIAAAGAAALGAGVALAAVERIDEPATVDAVARRLVGGPIATGGGGGGGGGISPRIGSCDVFPADNPWNRRVDTAPLRADSAAIIAKIGAIGGDYLHPDFGSNTEYGIPYRVVGPGEPLVPIEYTDYGDESDPGPFPIPLDAPIEGGSQSDGDRHVLVVRDGTCELFELYRAFPDGGRWLAASGARFDLSSNALRPLGWTSTDAAGLPVLAGLVRYDEVAAGEIRHAIRVTFAQTRRAYVLPATHWASSNTDPTLPPMGLRLRLSANFDISGFTGQARVVAVALQQYGLIVADNGSNWFFQGGSDARWDDDDLGQLKDIPGSAFEVVDSGAVTVP